VWFSVREPREETPVVVEVPHAGLLLDAPALRTLSAPAYSIAKDADLYVDELYQDAPALGAALLVAHASRYFCDLNRAEDNVDGDTVIGRRSHGVPHGVVWRMTTDKAPALTEPLGPEEFERRLEEVYRPYHRTLSGLVSRRVERFGYAVLLCAHSMPSVGRAGHRDPSEPRADIVPGSRNGTTADPRVVSAPESLARERSWSVAHDQPYRGGFSTGYYGKPGKDVHAIQVEISRRLYMDERTLRKNPNDFDNVRGFCRDLVARLAKLGLR
jgi:N-formylglutamate amidohydrolase